MSKKQKPSTACVHAGGSRSETTFSITPPIVHSAPFSFASTRELLDFMEGRSPRTQAEYGRMSNPTVTEVERREYETFQTAVVRPAVDLTRLELALVITDFEQIPLDESASEGP